MKKITNAFSLSFLAMALVACSGGSGGSSSSSSSSSTASNSATVSYPVTENFQIDGTTTQYTLTYTPVSVATDNVYVTPSNTTVQESNIYRVKPVATASQATLTEMVNYTNAVRAKLGLSELQIDQGLMAVAQRRAEEIVARYSHTRPDDTGLDSMFTRGSAFAENISAGQTSANLAMVSFENSADHYASMVNTKFTKTGVGFVYIPGSTYTYYWVQIFGSDDTTTNYAFDTSASAQQNKLAEVTTKATNINDRTKWMVVDDFAIRLENINPNGTWYSFSQSDGTRTYDGVVNGYSDVRFGLAQQSGSAHNVFYRGNNTAFESMPTTGTVTYTGKGVVTDGSNSRYVNSAFVADFANKQLNGTLSENGTTVTDIKAVIRGVEFHSPSDATVETQGGFFGTNASELGGVFYDHSNNQYGAFGAKQ